MTHPSTPQEAEVTREHRNAAHKCTHPELLTTGTEYWIESGDHRYMAWATPEQKETLLRTAQAIASAEARGRASREAEVEGLKAELAKAVSKFGILLRTALDEGERLDAGTKTAI